MMLHAHPTISMPIRLSQKSPRHHPASVKPYFWIGHCLTVFRWQAGGSRGQRLSLDSSRAGSTCLTCCYPATHFLSPPTRPYLSGWVIICRLPHSDRHHFSAAGSRGIGWLSLLVFASHRPCTLLPLPRPPPLSNRLGHYLSASALK